jgi:undecaprenyl pyrophosphate phosphatase UppP
MIWGASIIVGVLTILIFQKSSLWKSTLQIIESTKNVQSIFNGALSDDEKQAALLKNSKKQLLLSLKLFVQTTWICLPGLLFYYFFEEELFQKNNLLLTSIVSSLAAFFTYLITMKKSEK